MKLLFDTHALLWWFSDDRRLGRRALGLIRDPVNDVFVSVVSLWEIVVKVRVRKLEVAIGSVEAALLRDGFDRLPIRPAHLAVLSGLPTHHRDPFDHLLVAQAMSEDAVLISDDRNLERYAARLERCAD